MEEILTELKENDIIKNIKKIISVKIKDKNLHKYSSLGDDSNRLFHPIITCNLIDETVNIYMDVKCYNDRLKKDNSPLLLNIDFFDRVGTDYYMLYYNIYFISISYSAYMTIIFDEKERLLDTLSEIINNTKNKKIESNYCIEELWNLKDVDKPQNDF